METIKLIGRAKEKTMLHALEESPKSEFVALFGRRRVGKTFLVRRVFNDKFDFHLTGMANVTMAQQLGQFHAAMVTQAPGAAMEPAQDWFSAFRQLINYLETLPSDRKKVVFLDELPWLDTPRSRFVPALEHFWNSWASPRSDILLITCGSAASWMLSKLINNKGGLHNRITEIIKLDPFDLKETQEFASAKGAVFDRYQVLLLYMVFGGVPFYLDRLVPGYSAMQNINNLCFERNALFRNEFDNLYASLFNSHKRHIHIVEALATKNKGLSADEISQLSGVPRGGTLTQILHELQASNFIRQYRSFGKKTRDSLYQLIDPYSLFYLRFIRNSSRDEENFWINLTNSPVFYSWAGIAFEMVCLQHVRQIKHALGISGVQTAVSTWSSPHAQIDLLIDRKDQVINICEMKFSINEFAIDKRYAESLRNKLGNFQQETATRKALFLTLITTYGLAENQYKGMVQNDIRMDALFH